MENSLTGSKTGDQVGTVFALPNGNYVISSPLWNNSSINERRRDNLERWTPRYCRINKLHEQPCGLRQRGSTRCWRYYTAYRRKMNGSFVVSSCNRSNDIGGVDILIPNQVPEFMQQEYAANPDRDNTFTPAQITELLNAGNHVILKANNDITINSPVISDNPLGNGGNLALMPEKAF